MSLVSKIAIVLQAGPGSHEGLARAFHSLVYAKELSEQGTEVTVVFDGAATQWLQRFRNGGTAEEKGVGALFDELKGNGLVYEVCDYCAGAFGVKQDLKDLGEPLVAEYMDHPSIASLVADGYQILTL